MQTIKPLLVYVLAVMCIGFCHSLHAQSRDIRSHAEHSPNDGQVRLKYEYYHDMWAERDVKHGRYSEWVSNDRLVLDGFFFDGKRDSLWRSWYLDGGQKEASWWDRGERHGKTRTFDRKGRLTTEANYRNGRLHGLVYTYHKNGKVKSVAQYRDGRRHGHTTTYNRRGKRKRIVVYEDGRRKGRLKPGKPQKVKQQKGRKDERQDREKVPDPEKRRKKDKKAKDKPDTPVKKMILVEKHPDNTATNPTTNEQTNEQ